MAGIYQTFSKDGTPHEKWRYWYLDWQGKRVWKTGTEDAEHTLALAESAQRRAYRQKRDIELGIEKAPTSAEIASSRSAKELIDEYIAWGTAQGGRGGRPWARSHIESRQRHLSFWLKALSLQTLSDLGNGLLPRVERQLREYRIVPKKKKGVETAPTPRAPAGKTLGNYLEAIHSLCLWAKQRGYLDRDPLEGIQPFKADPVTQRRAMEPEEIRKLLESCRPHRRLLYEVALCTGLRANELRQLTPAHLDVEHSGLKLDAAWTKNRKAGFQPLPFEVVERLADFASSGEAARLYTRRKRNQGRKHETPLIRHASNPLLYVPTHPSREIERDLIKAGLSKYGPGGKVDFHACRVAYITLVDEAGASVQEGQSLARHSDPRMTERYRRTRNARLQKLTDAVGEMILPPDSCGTAVERKAAGAESLSNPSGDNGLESKIEWRRRESNTLPVNSQHEHGSDVDTTNIDVCEHSKNSSQNLRHGTAAEGTSKLHQKTPVCGISVERESLHGAVDAFAAQMNSAEAFARLQAQAALDNLLNIQRPSPPISGGGGDSQRAKGSSNG